MQLVALGSKTSPEVRRENVTSLENCINGGNPLFIGWDVGGWNCDKNPDSRDALIVLDHTAQCIGQPFWGNLRETINGATSSVEFLSALLKLCEPDVSAPPQHATIAIDAPLGFPEAFTGLITGGIDVGQIGHSSATNPYLFRHTERRLVDEGITPLSAIRDMIGSQATKAMHVVARFAPRLQERGVWTDDNCLTIIETYPSLCRARRSLPTECEPSPKKGCKADIRDAKVCAKVAHAFKLSPECLEHPGDDVPESEGWIWAPLPIRD